MKKESRIASVLGATQLDLSSEEIQTFDLSALGNLKAFSANLPTNVRLGHLVERVVSNAFKASCDYRLIDENIQIVEDKLTIGELDFIFEDLAQSRTIHLELAYKFYLYDPTLSSDPIKNWIGPNRKDSLSEKLEKLKGKQFPLLFHPAVQSRLSDIDVFKVEQALCFLASLYLPYGFEAEIEKAYQKAVKGYYMDFKMFSQLDHSSKSYFIPRKTEWGIDPSENENWSPFAEVKEEILNQLREKRAPLCWQKEGDTYSEFFVVWW